jgi:hypothetical protein
MSIQTLEMKVKVLEARLQIAVEALEELADARGNGYDGGECEQIAKHTLYRMAHEATKG